MRELTEKIDIAIFLCGSLTFIIHTRSGRN
jgi:hypothetical protein